MGAEAPQSKTANIVSFESERKRKQRECRHEEAVTEGRIVANRVDKDGVPLYRIHLAGTGAELFRRLSAAGTNGVFPDTVTLDARDQLEWAGVKTKQWGGLRGRLALKFGASAYVLEEGSLECAAS